MTREADIKLQPKLINSSTGRDLFHHNKKLAKFLAKHSFSEVSKDQAFRALEDVFDPSGEQGGFILLGLDGDKVIAAIVVHEYGSTQKPESQIVHLAVRKKYRKHQPERQLVKNSLKISRGDMVVKNDVAGEFRGVLQEAGFKEEDREMRYKREKAHK